MRRHHALTPVVLAVLALGLSGCYMYVPVEPALPAPGQYVRASVNGEAASRMTSILGPGVTEVHGMVLRQEDRAVSVLVQSYVTQRAGLLSGYNEPVLLRYPEIQDLTVKQFSTKRSVLFGAAFVGVAVLTATVFTDLGWISSDDDPEPETPPEMTTRRGFRIPLVLRIPVSIR